MTVKKNIHKFKKSMKGGSNIEDLKRQLKISENILTSTQKQNNDVDVSQEKELKSIQDETNPTLLDLYSTNPDRDRTELKGMLYKNTKFHFESAKAANSAAISSLESEVADLENKINMYNKGVIRKGYNKVTTSASKYKDNVSKNPKSNIFSSLVGVAVGTGISSAIYRKKKQTLKTKIIQNQREIIKKPSLFLELDEDMKINKDNILTLLELGANIVIYLPTSIKQDSNFINELLSNTNIIRNNGIKKELNKIKK